MSGYIFIFLNRINHHLDNRVNNLLWNITFGIILLLNSGGNELYILIHIQKHIR